MAVEYLDKGNDDGTSFGQSASEKISFHGATPIVQRSGAAQAVVTPTCTSIGTTAATTTTPYGYTTTTQADGIVTQLNKAVTDVLALTVLVNELRAALVALGAIKGGT